MRQSTEQGPLSRCARIKRPLAMKKGGVIGLAAPASCFDPDLYKAGLARIRSLGFEVRAPEEAFRRNGYLAGTDQQRAAGLMNLWNDPEIGAIICARGGYGAMRVLPLLDFDRLADNPKIFIGFSDITALLAALVDKAGLTVFHGPVLTSLGRDAANPEKEIQDLAKALSGESPLKLEAVRPYIVVPGQARGPVKGGNLTILAHLCGTPYAPDLSGAILFLEDCAEAPYRLDRKLIQMQLSGMLNGLAGVVLGDFIDCGPAKEVYRIMGEIFAPMKVPVLAGFECGHGPRNQAFPLGLEAVLDTNRARLEFMAPATEKGGGGRYPPS